MQHLSRNSFPIPRIVFTGSIISPSAVTERHTYGFCTHTHLIHYTFTFNSHHESHDTFHGDQVPTLNECCELVICELVSISPLPRQPTGSSAPRPQPSPVQQPVAVNCAHREHWFRDFRILTNFEVASIARTRS